MTTTALFLLLAGMSETVGRIFPTVSRRHGGSSRLVVLSLVVGTFIEAAVFSAWPWVAALLARRVAGAEDASLHWTPGLVSPLLLTAVLAFPLAGPVFHGALVVGVCISLSDALDTLTSVGLPLALACVAAAGVGLTITVKVARRVVARVLTSSPREVVQ